MARKADPAAKGSIPPLQGAQREASAPDALVWLSASAGTGKTQVLSSRVLRLLLTGVAPETILCLTFTKAGASEMAKRVNQQLARWVMADEASLFHDLEALGADSGPEAREIARTLFARLLDARGGGLRIQTIHSFCQSLLSAFPLEADLPPGFALMDDREAALLARRSFSELMAEAEQQDGGLLSDLAGKLGLRLGEDKAMGYLRTLAPLADALEALPASLEGMKRWMHRTLSGGSSDIVADHVLDQIGDPLPAILLEYRQGLIDWGTPTGVERVAFINQWIAADLPGRIAGFAAFERAWLTGDGKPYAYNAKTTAHMAPQVEELAAWSLPISGFITLAEQADYAAEAVLLGRAYALRHAQAKRDAGFVDYQDLILRAERLLSTPGMGNWVRFKLDQSTDHILIDEAQDTNQSQWDIVKALTDDYFSGAGTKGDRLRTLFTVGDFKQAIFGFQGTDPENFRAAQHWFAERAAGVDRELLDLSLSQSFRSAQPILDVADAVIDCFGHEALGMDVPVDRHVSADQSWPGDVVLTPPVMVTEEEPAEDAGEEEWIGEADRLLAANIADQIHHWWKVEPLWIARANRPFRPGDVMILLRARAELARLIVARLHERGIPVAGLDRLRLGAPLAVQDLLACARFAMQPEDDLNLAGLLVSPLVGLTQEQLYAAAKQRKGHLWPHLEDSLRAQLLPILNAADMTSPYRFFETILSGPMQGRKRLLARLGEEARDPVNALLSAALEFEATHPPSLQLFLDWFDKSDSEIKRDAEGGHGAVRVMTAHGAKGLQAPVVILADATKDPKKSKANTLSVTLLDGTALPLPRPSKEFRTYSYALIETQRADNDMQEHRRLLYVALTRAEQKLIITGALKKGDPPDLSWYADVERAFHTLDHQVEVAPIWGGSTRCVSGGLLVPREEAQQQPPSARPALPAWIDTKPAVEAAPARPLAPSSLGKDDASDPPADAARAAAAERGRHLHALFERLPPLAPEDRRMAALAWLEKSAGITDAAARDALAETALSIIADPAHANWFSPDALAEAPVAGVVDGFVVAGTVDRMLVSEDAVKLVDFKTGRFVPRDAGGVPISHARQMAAYARLLADIFPGKRIEAALLYTSGPRLILLPSELLERHKPDLAWQQEVLPAAG